MKIYFIILILICFSIGELYSQRDMSAFVIPRVKYSGGGDWYNDPSSEINLLRFISQNTNIKTNAIYKFVDLASTEIFNYPLLFLTGHGNVNFSQKEINNLKAYLQNGGFLYIDDDYGLDEFIRKEMKKIFPEQEFVELPFSHPIFSIQYNFPNGIPKIHEHDNKAPKTFGLFHQGRLCVVYTWESNPSDGWADPEVHRNSAEKRTDAFKFGTNLVVWALTH